MVWYPLLKDNVTDNKLSKIISISKLILQIVVAIAGNKYDMYEYEEVEEDKVKAYARVRT